MCFDNFEAVALLGQSEEEREYLCQLVNELAQQMMRGSLSAIMALPLKRYLEEFIWQTSLYHHPNESPRH